METVALIDRLGDLQLIDRETKALKLTANVHEDAAYDVDWHPAGDRIVTAGEDGTARVIEALSGRLVDSFNGHRTQVRRAAWSPDGTRLATAAIHGEALIWTASEAAAIRTFVAPGLIPFHVVGELSWDRDGDALIATSQGRTAAWSLSSGALKVDRASGGLEEQSPDGRWAAWAIMGSTLAVAAAGTAESPRVLDLGDDPWLYTEWAPDSSTVFSANAFGLFAVTVLGDGELTPRRLAETRGQIFDVDVALGGARVAVGTTDESVLVVDPRGVAPVVTIALPSRVGPRGVALSPDAALVAAGCSDGFIRVYNSDAGTEAAVWSGHMADIIDIAWHPSGDRVATGGEDRSVKVWDVDTGDLLASFPTRAHVASVCWLRDGMALACLDLQGTVTLWDASRSMSVDGRR